MAGFSRAIHSRASGSLTAQQHPIRRLDALAGLLGHLPQRLDAAAHHGQGTFPMRDPPCGPPDQGFPARRPDEPSFWISYPPVFRNARNASFFRSISPIASRMKPSERNFFGMVSAAFSFQPDSANSRSARTSGDEAVQLIPDPVEMLLSVSVINILERRLGLEHPLPIGQVINVPLDPDPVGVCFRGGAGHRNPGCRRRVSRPFIHEPIPVGVVLVGDQPVGADALVQGASRGHGVLGGEFRHVVGESVLLEKLDVWAKPLDRREGWNMMRPISM